MEIHKALDQISEIHGQLAKAGTYQGYRAVPVALSGAFALLAGALQARVIGNESPQAFVVYWLGVAFLAAVISAGGIVYSYVHQESQLTRRRTRIVVGQLLPCLAAGAMVTVPFTVAGSDFIAFLPGIWAILYGLGVFASRPYLPKMIGWIALFYFAAGGILLTLADGAASLSPWGVGLTFGVGQVLAGIVLYWNLERKNGG